MPRSRPLLVQVHRPLGAVAGGVAAGCLAAVMALAINLGILGAIGTPDGPGRLGLPVVASSEPFATGLPDGAGPPPCRAPIGAGRAKSGAPSRAAEQAPMRCLSPAPSPSGSPAPTASDDGGPSRSGGDD